MTTAEIPDAAIDPAGWLRAHVDNDQRIAQAAADAGHPSWTLNDDDYWLITHGKDDVVVYDEGSPREGEAEHIARHDPARVLAQTAAIRAVLDELEKRRAAEANTLIESRRLNAIEHEAISAIEVAAAHGVHLGALRNAVWRTT